MIEARRTTKRVLGIDYGAVRIGIALSDETRTIAVPLQTLQADKKIEVTIEALVRTISEIETSYRCEIEEIVTGLPLMMNGRVGTSADNVLRFVELLSARTSIPIKTWDERLTTVQAERSLKGNALNRKKRSKTIDVVSASIILQTYLDYKTLRPMSGQSGQEP